MKEEQGIRVYENAGLIDSLQAVARYTVVIVGFITALLGLFKTHDIDGIILYIQNNGGEALAAVSGLIALGTAGYGVFKSWKRGRQVSDVAANPEVPENIATLK